MSAKTVGKLHPFPWLIIEEKTQPQASKKSSPVALCAWSARHCLGGVTPQQNTAYVLLLLCSTVISGAICSLARLL